MLNHETELDTNTHYGDIYIGVVEDNNDPKKMGRVRVRILGFHASEKTFDGQAGVAVSELPWATPCIPIAGGGISGLGWSGVPVNGSHVALFFINGDHNYPVYFGTIQSIYKTKPDTKNGFCDPSGTYPKEINTPDFNSLASTTNTVFETPDNGVRVEYDSTNGSEKYKVTLKKTGAYINISQDGSFTIYTTGGNLILQTDKKVYVKAGEEIHHQVGNTALTALDGVVTKQCICSFTGQPHPFASTVVKASKGA